MEFKRAAIPTFSSMGLWTLRSLKPQLLQAFLWHVFSFWWLSCTEYITDGKWRILFPRSLSLTRAVRVLSPAAILMTLHFAGRLHEMCHAWVNKHMRLEASTSAWLFPTILFTWYILYCYAHVYEIWPNQRVSILVICFANYSLECSSSLPERHHAILLSARILHFSGHPLWLVVFSFEMPRYTQSTQTPLWNDFKMAHFVT